MKVLVTAFKPFNKANNNYSTEVLNYLTDVTKLIIDVNYDESYNEIIKNYNLADFDLVLSMGEARMRSELTLEVIAKNISSCSIPDNSGVYRKEEVIIENAPLELKTKINTRTIEELVTLSYDAGKFVCNNLYYHLLYNCPNKAVFIHIPNCEDKVENYKKYALAIQEIINKILMEE